MDGTGKHYAEQNKPGGESQIPYDLTFNRNLINKTNKQKINDFFKENCSSLWEKSENLNKTKWNKPGGERQIPYDLTYKWNLIKKTSKQACLLYTSDAADDSALV